ncbi:hypothetical protein JCM6294_3261 [Bacteroides pyogenes DSM 20611 = JCM 6294]|uniref:Uncharacterized protein n=1 Tax=Bacteroides pyogenes DSM 20611 = JCM 6294 TaxID=1121100 RepID=W4PJW9_9BACE|nr:hypothetical protein JCM6294_3261 [Bacteroides pyogenes DSM 20611 = JCM 6294]
MEQINKLKELINQGEVDKAIEQLDLLLQDSSDNKEKEVFYYLRGNAYRKKEDWKQLWIITSTPSSSIPKVLPCKPERW